MENTEVKPGTIVEVWEGEVGTGFPIAPGAQRVSEWESSHLYPGTYPFRAVQSKRTGTVTTVWDGTTGTITWKYDS